MDYKKTKAPNSTITRDLSNLEIGTGNIYETIAIVAKRADQIEVELKKELDAKLEEFASISDNLEEVLKTANKSKFLNFTNVFLTLF